MICPYCQTKIKSKDEAIICPVCHTPHHKECWKENGGCTTYGCKGKGEDIGNLTIEEIEKLKYPAAESPIEEKTEDTNDFHKEVKLRYEELSKLRKYKLIPLISAIMLTCLIIFAIAFTFIKIDEYVSSENYKISNFISEWKSSWEHKNIKEYESFLDKDYQYIEDGKIIKRDERLKRLATNFKSNDDIKITITSSTIAFDSTSTNYVNVNFIQKYTSGKVSEIGKKTLRLYRGEETLYKWKIYREFFDKFY